MKNLKEKAPVFLLGLMFGLIIAGGFFILKLDDYFKELSVFRTASDASESSLKTPEKPEKKEEERVSSKKQKTKNGSLSLSVQTMNEDAASAGITDSVTNGTPKDSVALKSQDDIVVKKDELLSTITLEVLNLNPVASRTAKDSLLQKVSGVRDDKSSGKQMFNIEFWSSPLNYRGYKMSKYKIILYGIPGPEGLKLYKLDDAIYVRSSGMVYQLDYVSDFKQYERITDEAILSRLK